MSEYKPLGAPEAQPEVRVAIVGVGNCASSLVQGVEYYHNADDSSTVPGLMHVRFGPYHVRDVKFVAAFDHSPEVVGQEAGSLRVLGMESLRAEVRAKGIRIGVIGNLKPGRH